MKLKCNVVHTQKSEVHFNRNKIVFNTSIEVLKPYTQPMQWYLNINKHNLFENSTTMKEIILRSSDSLAVH